jgi:Flp pilus assembly protein TadD
MKIVCPGGTCRTENEADAEVCVQCSLPLKTYSRMMIYPAQLFNEGLSQASKGNFARARDLFAAIVYWCPMDMEARNALAMSYVALGDEAGASLQWETLLEKSPADSLARQCLTLLKNAPAKVEEAVAVESGKSRQKDTHQPRARGKSNKQIAAKIKMKGKQKR